MHMYACVFRNCHNWVLNLKHLAAEWDNDAINCLYSHEAEQYGKFYDNSVDNSKLILDNSESQILC